MPHIKTYKIQRDRKLQLIVVKFIDSLPGSPIFALNLFVFFNNVLNSIGISWFGGDLSALNKLLVVSITYLMVIKVSQNCWIMCKSLVIQNVQFCSWVLIN